MPLTYAVAEDFIEMKDLTKSGIVVNISDIGRDKIESYLLRATRFIQRHTRRDFFPWRETRSFPIPHAFHNLSMRRYPAAHLIVDQDLIEIFTLNNGSEDVDPSFYYNIETNIKPHYGIAIKFPKYWGGLFGGVSPYKRYDEPIITVDALWGYAENIGGYRYPTDFWISTNYALESALNATDTGFGITNVDERVDDVGENPFVKGRLLRIDDEYMEVTSVNTTTDVVSVKRGVRGSTASEHDVNSLVDRWRVIDDIVEACLQIAKTWREADLAVGGRVGVSDVSVGAEIAIPSDPMGILDSYQRSQVLE